MAEIVDPVGDLSAEARVGLELGGIGIEVYQPRLGLHDEIIRFNRRCPSHKFHLSI